MLLEQKSPAASRRTILVFVMIHLGPGKCWKRPTRTARRQNSLLAGAPHRHQKRIQAWQHRRIREVCILHWLIWKALVVNTSKTGIMFIPAKELRRYCTKNTSEPRKVNSTSLPVIRHSFRSLFRRILAAQLIARHGKNAATCLASSVMYTNDDVNALGAAMTACTMSLFVRCKETMP